MALRARLQCTGVRGPRGSAWALSTDEPPYSVLRWYGSLLPRCESRSCFLRVERMTVLPPAWPREKRRKGRGGVCVRGGGVRVPVHSSCSQPRPLLLSGEWWLLKSLRRSPPVPPPLPPRHSLSGSVNGGRCVSFGCTHVLCGTRHGGVVAVRIGLLRHQARAVRSCQQSGGLSAV